MNRQVEAQPLRARIEYERDGTILFRLDGHDAPRFERIIAALQSTVPVAEREWRADLGLWVIDAGWDEELLEILEDHCERADILVGGLPLDTREDEEPLEDEARPLIRPLYSRHAWIDLDDWPRAPLPLRVGRLILPYWGENRE
jgi:hypothetical protein